MSLFHEGADGILGRFEEDPTNASPVERYVLGLSFVTLSIGPDSSQLTEEQRTSLFEGGSEILIPALHEIRIVDDLTEQEKLSYSLQTFKHLDFSQLPASEEQAQLLTGSLLLMIRGLETPIRQENEDSWERFRIGNLELAAMVTLAGKTNELNPKQQLEYLEEKLSTMEDADEETGKELVLVWGKRLALEAASETEVGEMLGYFFEREDLDSADQIILGYLEQAFSS